MLKYKKNLLAFSILLQVLLVNWLSQYPEFIENYYSGGVYPYMSSLMRYVFGWSPVSVGDILYTLTGIYIIRWLIKNLKRIKGNFKGIVIDILVAISIGYFAFHVLWGLNYYREPLHKTLHLDVDYTTEQLLETTTLLIEKTNKIHVEITKNDTVKVVLPYKDVKVFDLVPEGYKVLQKQFPELHYQPESIKKSLFSLPLTYMGFNGYLNPFTNEAQVDYLVPNFKKPMISSHEVAHQLGYAAENEANFIGILASTNHDDVYFKYSGLIFALKHCLYEIYNRDELLYEECKALINEGVLKNYKESQEFIDSYKNPLKPVFKVSYDSFLKANNQTKGIESYNYVVALLVNYYKKNAL